MVRTRGQEMRRLQRKLIPVNLLVCILCIVAAVSLFFTPLLKIDLGKILKNEQMQQTILDGLGGSLGGDGGSSASALSDEEGSGEESKGNANMDIDMGAIVKAVLLPILNGVDAQIVISPMAVTKLAFSDNPGDVLMKTYLTGEGGLVEQLVNSLTETISKLGENKEVTDEIEKMVVGAVASGLKESLPEGFKEAVNVEDLQETITKLGEAKTEDAAVKTIMNYMDDLAEKNEGVSALSAEEKESLEKSVRKMYSEVVKETKNEETGEDNFSIEALICVMASKGLNESLGEGGIGSLFDGLLGNNGDNGNNGESSVKAVKYVLTEGEEGESGSTESGSTEGGSTESGSTEGGSTETEKPKGEIYTSYKDLFGSLISEEDTAKMVDQIKTSINGQVGGLTDSINQQKAALMGAWGGLMFFIALWVILFLFAFFHMFARNKRFTMWYVKLFAPYPCIIFWLAPTVAKILLAKGVIKGIDAATASIASAVLGGISSMAWIMGLCYLLLWFISIFWAFPIKRKIRRLKKQARDD